MQTNGTAEGKYARIASAIGTVLSCIGESEQNTEFIKLTETVREDRPDLPDHDVTLLTPWLEIEQAAPASAAAATAIRMVEHVRCTSPLCNYVDTRHLPDEYFVTKATLENGDSPAAVRNSQRRCTGCKGVNLIDETKKIRTPPTVLHLVLETTVADPCRQEYTVAGHAYHLQAYVLHKGNGRTGLSGHYTSVTRDRQGDGQRWLLWDDGNPHRELQRQHRKAHLDGRSKDGFRIRHAFYTRGGRAAGVNPETAARAGGKTDGSTVSSSEQLQRTAPARRPANPSCLLLPELAEQLHAYERGRAEYVSGYVNHDNQARKLTRTVYDRAPIVNTTQIATPTQIAPNATQIDHYDLTQEDEDEAPQQRLRPGLAKRVKITLQEIGTLAAGEMINDAPVTAWLKSLLHQHIDTTLTTSTLYDTQGAIGLWARCARCIHEPESCTTCSARAHNQIRTRKRTLREKATGTGKFIIPINLNNTHYVVVLVNLFDKTLHIRDTMGGSHANIARHTLEWFAEEHALKQRAEQGQRAEQRTPSHWDPVFDKEGWIRTWKTEDHGGPMQGPGNNCMLYIAMHALHFAGAVAHPPQACDVGMAPLRLEIARWALLQADPRPVRHAATSTTPGHVSHATHRAPREFRDVPRRAHSNSSGMTQALLRQAEARKHAQAKVFFLANAQTHENAKTHRGRRRPRPKPKRSGSRKRRASRSGESKNTLIDDGANDDDDDGDDDDDDDDDGGGGGGGGSDDGGGDDDSDDDNEHDNHDDTDDSSCDRAYEDGDEQEDAQMARKLDRDRQNHGTDSETTYNTRSKSPYDAKGKGTGDGTGKRRGTRKDDDVDDVKDVTDEEWREDQSRGWDRIKVVPTKKNAKGVEIIGVEIIVECHHEDLIYSAVHAARNALQAHNNKQVGGKAWQKILLKSASPDGKHRRTGHRNAEQNTDVQNMVDFLKKAGCVLHDYSDPGQTAQTSRQITQATSMLPAANKLIKTAVSSNTGTASSDWIAFHIIANTKHRTDGTQKQDTHFTGVTAAEKHTVVVDTFPIQSAFGNRTTIGKQLGLKANGVYTPTNADVAAITTEQTLLTNLKTSERAHNNVWIVSGAAKRFTATQQDALDRPKLRKLKEVLRRLKCSAAQCSAHDECSADDGAAVQALEDALDEALAHGHQIDDVANAVDECLPPDPHVKETTDEAETQIRWWQGEDKGNAPKDRTTRALHDALGAPPDTGAEQKPESTAAPERAGVPLGDDHTARSELFGRAGTAGAKVAQATGKPTRDPHGPGAGGSEHEIDAGGAQREENMHTARVELHGEAWTAKAEADKAAGRRTLDPHEPSARGSDAVPTLRSATAGAPQVPGKRSAVGAQPAGAQRAGPVDSTPRPTKTRAEQPPASPATNTASAPGTRRHGDTNTDATTDDAHAFAPSQIGAGRVIDCSSDDEDDDGDDDAHKATPKPHHGAATAPFMTPSRTTLRSHEKGDGPLEAAARHAAATIKADAPRAGAHSGDGTPKEMRDAALNNLSTEIRLSVQRAVTEAHKRSRRRRPILKEGDLAWYTPQAGAGQTATVISRDEESVKQWRNCTSDTVVYTVALKGETTNCRTDLGSLTLHRAHANGGARLRRILHGITTTLAAEIAEGMQQIRATIHSATDTLTRTRLKAAISDHANKDTDSDTGGESDASTSTDEEAEQAGEADDERSATHRPFLWTAPIALFETMVNKWTKETRAAAARAFGITDDEAQAYPDTVPRIHEQLRKHHEKVLREVCQRPLPSCQEYEDNPALLPPGITDSNKTKSEKEARKHFYRKEYARRQFEIERRTIHPVKCNCCVFRGVVAGVFAPCMRRSGGSKGGGMWHRSTAGVLKTHVVERIKGSEPGNGGQVGHLVLRKEAQAQEMASGGNWQRVRGEVCAVCIKDMTTRRETAPGGDIHVIGAARQPRFSKPGGFHHGMDRPDCLKGLTHAELCLISPIQAALCMTTVKYGKKTMKGGITYIDRCDDIQDVAKLVPLLPREVEHLILHTVRGTEEHPHPEICKHSVVNRARVQAAILWLIRESPAFEYYGITFDQSRLDQLLPKNVKEGVPEEFYVDLDAQPTNFTFTVTSACSESLVGGYVYAATGVYKNGRDARIQRTDGEWHMHPPRAGDGPDRPVYTATARNEQPPPTTTAAWSVTKHMAAAAGDVGTVQPLRFRLTRCEPDGETDGPTRGLRRPEGANNTVEIQVGGTVRSTQDPTSAITSTDAGIEAVLGRKNASMLRAETEQKRVVYEGGEATPVFTHGRARLVKKWTECPFFWGLAFPHLFMPSEEKEVHKRDFPAAYRRERGRRHTNPTLPEWARYMSSCDDMRYSRDRKLTFVLLNMKQQEQAAKKVSYSTQCKLKEANKCPTIGDIREQFAAAMSAEARTPPDAPPQPANNERDTLAAMFRHGEPNGARADPPAATDNSRPPQTGTAGNHAPHVPSKSDLRALALRVCCTCDDLPGSPPYWWGKKKEVDALVHKGLNEQDQLPLLFLSGSMAEFHWPEIGEVLTKLLQSIDDEAGQDMDKGVQPLADGNIPNYAQMITAIRDFPGTINEIFHLRVEAFFLLVLKQAYNVEDYWYRIEFSKLRGAAHFHGLAWVRDTKEICGTLEEACTAEDLEESQKAERKAATRLSDSLPKYGIHYTALHAAGRKRDERLRRDEPVVSEWHRTRLRANSPQESEGMSKAQRGRLVRGTDVHKNDTGNIDCWPPPEGRKRGTFAKHVYKPLRTMTYQLKEKGEEEEDAMHFDSKCNLHTCTTDYCLKDRGKRGRDKRTNEVRVVLECRFGFGTQNRHGRGTEGKAARRKPEILFDGRGVASLAPEQDHPRKNAGDDHMSRTWAGNMDLSLIIAPTDEQTSGPHTNSLMAFLTAETNRLQGSAHKDRLATALHELNDARPWRDKAVYAQGVSNYVVAYCCKGEVSAQACADMLTNILRDKTVRNDSSFTYMARMLTARMMSTRELSDSEAMWLLLQLPLTRCSRGFDRVSLDTTRRNVHVFARNTTAANDRPQVLHALEHMDMFTAELLMMRKPPEGGGQHPTGNEIIAWYDAGWKTLFETNPTIGDLVLGGVDVVEYTRDLLTTDTTILHEGLAGIQGTLKTLRGNTQTHAGTGNGAKQTEETEDLCAVGLQADVQASPWDKFLKRANDDTTFHEYVSRERYEKVAKGPQPQPYAAGDRVDMLFNNKEEDGVKVANGPQPQPYAAGDRVHMLFNNKEEDGVKWSEVQGQVTTVHAETGAMDIYFSPDEKYDRVPKDEVRPAKSKADTKPARPTSNAARARQTRHKVPIYLGAATTARWPLTEAYAETMLMLHKKSIRKLEDVMGESLTCRDELERLMDKDAKTNKKREGAHTAPTSEEEETGVYQPTVPRTQLRRRAQQPNKSDGTNKRKITELDELNDESDCDTKDGQRTGENELPDFIARDVRRAAKRSIAKAAASDARTRRLEREEQATHGEGAKDVQNSTTERQEDAATNTGNGNASTRRGSDDGDEEDDEEEDDEEDDEEFLARVDRREDHKRKRNQQHRQTKTGGRHEVSRGSAGGELGVGWQPDAADDDPNALQQPAAQGAGQATEYAKAGYALPHNPATPSMCEMTRMWNGLTKRARKQGEEDGVVRVPRAPTKAAAKGFTFDSPMMTMGNEKQRQYITDLLRYFNQHANYRSVNPHARPEEGPKFHAVLLGKAGTGKSLASVLTLALTRLYYGDAKAAAIATPTGAAAVVVDGVTVDTDLGIDRSATECKLPTKVKEMQTNFARRRCMVIDEISMIGHKFLGIIHRRMTQVMCDGQGLFPLKPFGGLDVVVLSGVPTTGNHTIAGGGGAPKARLPRECRMRGYHVT